MLVAVTAVASPTAVAAPATPHFGPGIDRYQPGDFQRTCDPTAKPGVVDFADLLDRTYGVHTRGISRDCGQGGQSEHKEGRALDYHFNVNNPKDAADAQDLLNWLLATDQHGNTHAMARRLGIMYVIWNRRIWESYRPGAGWQPYTGPNPHTDHVHVSFGWDGARRQTTWWTAAGVPQAVTGTLADTDGDGRVDLLARDGGGALWLYPNTGNAADPYNGDVRRQVGVGWNVMTKILAVDVDADFRADLVARDGGGNLWLYPHTGDPNDPFNGDFRRHIGVGWNTMTSLSATDVNGDGRTDLVARDGGGNLWLYPNTGIPDDPYNGDFRRHIGVNWNTMTAILGTDADADGRNDLIARDTSGNLWLYPNTGNPDDPYNGDFRRHIGVNWNTMTAILGADADADGRNDLIARDTSGNLWLYPNTGNPNDPYNGDFRRHIGVGWQHMADLS
ncbi:hypothetical protein AB0A74_00500 [Saccharothrix sp. NPDC042600]|uniref:hypothetical protein n=1 Tax=Saccharothrix TaxID=2071 RepID=UPI0033E0559B|nr:hypothetical protein GCM10017745_47840 [Saccharothrix mutabilis subsp. capreolus]